MKSPRMHSVLAALGALALLVASAVPAAAQAQTIKIGTLYDHSGPFSAAGSLNCWRGAKMVIDYVNEKGGVLGKYKIVQVDGDSQSKADVAINEAERLLNVEKVDILAGIYSSAHAVPIAERVDKQKKFLWITTAIADAVVKDRNLQYTFRPQANGSLFGTGTVDYIAHYAQDKLKKPVKDLRVAIIHEDGPYGVGVAASNESEAKKVGMQVVLKEGYSVQAADLSSLVTKLRAARPDVLFHTGYNPDIALFLRQAREQGLKFRALIGHGAGYGVYDKLKEAIGKDVNLFFNVDPISIWLANEKALKPELLPLIKMVGEEYEKARPGVAVKSAHVGMAASNTYLFMTQVLPKAIKKYGGIDAEALRQAALEVDLPEGGTMLGFGVKFQGNQDEMAGQNDRAFPVIVQYVDDKPYVVWPKSLQLRAPTLPLPKSSPYAM